MTYSSSLLRLFDLIFFYGVHVFGQNSSKELTVSGHVYDEQSGEVLIAANIYDPTKTYFTTTNAYDFFP
jgi:hypothetical protein